MSYIVDAAEAYFTSGSNNSGFKSAFIRRITFFNANIYLRLSTALE